MTVAVQKIELLLKKSKLLFNKLNFIRKFSNFKNLNFGRKSNFLSKIELLFKNRTFIQKSKFYSKLEILFEKSKLLFKKLKF